MSACARCGTACSDGAAFCGYCGAPQAAPSVSVSAPLAAPPAVPQPACTAPPAVHPPAASLWQQPQPRQRPRRRSRAIPILLLAVVVLGAAGFGAYRLGLVPTLTDRIDGLLGAARALPGSSSADGFVAADGEPVDAGTFGMPAGSVGMAREVSADAPFIAPDVDRAALDADLSSIEAAFASNDPAKVAAWIHPGAREQLGAAFAANAARLGEVATLLATRRPVFVGTKYAEYQVTDAGSTFTVEYQKSGDHWMLVGL